MISMNAKSLITVVFYPPLASKWHVRCNSQCHLNEYVTFFCLGKGGYVSLIGFIAACIFLRGWYFWPIAVPLGIAYIFFGLCTFSLITKLHDKGMTLEEHAPVSHAI